MKKLKKLMSIQSIAIVAIAFTMVVFSSCKKDDEEDKDKDPVIEIETFTDSRDGNVYKIVTIGNQTWMAENFAYKPNSGYWAYENSDGNVSSYGYLYTLETAKKYLSGRLACAKP